MIHGGIMKKLILLFTLSLLLVGMAWGQGTETFDNLTLSGTSYTTGSFLGQDGSTWNFTKCRGDQPITGKAIMIGRSQTPQSFVESGTISNGIGTLSFDYKRSFSTNVNLKVFINDTEVGNVTSSDADVHNSGNIAVNVSGGFVLKFMNANNADGQVQIDNITWTAYGSSSSTISVNPGTLTGFSYQTGNGPSTAQSFTVSGTNLSANINLAASTNYEISLSAATGYTTPLILSQTSGSVGQTTIYVRLKAGLATGTYSAETINITSTGASAQTIACSGSVSALAAPNPPVATDATNIATNSFSANWTAVSGATNYYLDVYTKVGSGNASDLFISEYIEGSSNNKYIEIYNGTAGSVDLSGYSLKQYNNGSATPTYTLALTGSLASGSVFVIAHSSATIYGGTPDLSTAVSAMGFNGNDAMALFNGTTLIDVVGPIGDANDWGKDVTLVRNANAPVPSTTYTASDWDSYATDTVSYLGSHTFSGGSSNSFVSGYENRNVGNVISFAVTGLNPLTAYYYAVRSSNANGTSANSNEKTATTTAGSNPPPAPVATSATSIGQNSFVANWDAAATATSYRLDVSTVNTFASFVTGYNNLTVNSTSQTVSGLAANALYYYRIRAYNSYGTSSSSNVISANTLVSDTFNGYYNPVAGLSGASLKTGLKDLIDNNTYSNYTGAKTELFQNLDNDGNGNVTCVYTGQTWAVSSSYNGSSNPNTEHTYAQSWFSGAEGSTKKADVHHLFVSNSSVNSSRGNLPFDVVSNANATYSSDPAYVSKRGTNANGKTVFEPADPHKGNLARALLYFHVRYGQTLSQGGVDMLDRLITWHNADPVDAHELARNALVYAHQNNRNPFVDHPEYVSSIWGGAVATTVLQFSPASAEVNEGDGSVTLNVTITNPASTPTTAQVALSSGDTADINSYTTQLITFPANSGLSQTVTVGITDDTLLEGTETLVFSLINVSGGNSAAAGNYSSFNLTIIDNDIPVPVATAATLPSMNGFTANWNAISGITDFELDLSSSATFATFVSGYQDLLVTGTSLDITGLNAGTTYYYRLRAVYNESAGLNSNVIMANTEEAVGLLLEENFNYTAGLALTSMDNWTAHSSGGTNTIFVTTNNLSYAGYPSVSGNAATLSSSGEDVNCAFPAQNSGNVYASFLVNVTSAKTAGDYIFHFSTENVSTSFFRGRVFIQKDTATDNFRFGLSNTSALDPAITTSYDYSYGNSYLVVIRYDFVEGEANDVVNMWINPSISSIEPAAHLTSTDVITSEPANLGSIALRQGNSSNAPALTIDGIRVASTWSHLFPSAPSVPIVEVLPTNLSGFSYVAGHGPSAEQSFNVNGINLTGNITLTAPADYEISTGSGQSFLATSPLTLNHTAGVVNSTAIYTRLKANLAVGDYANEQIVIASAGVSPNKSVSCSGSVTEAVIAPELFISEYIEGNVGNDKAIEIFNASGAEIDLSQFSVKLGTNGGAWSTTGIALSGTLANHGVYVLANNTASAAILALADETSTSLSHNGDDAIGLFYGSTLIDIIGVQGVDPGTGWPVAGIANATKDHTLIRKPSVIQGNTNWASSAGTDANDSEWIVMPVNYFNDLGTHSFNSGADLDTPIVTILHNGNNVELSWIAITGASSYRIESSDDPYGTFTQIGSTTVNTNISISATDTQKFFRVIALP